MDASFAQEPTRLIDAMLIRPRLAGLCILVGVLLLIIPSFSGGVCAAGLQSEAEPHALKEAQAAFDKKEYQQALERLERADKGGALNADALRLKVRAQLRLGKPREALLDYEALERKMTGEDLVLLKEVVLGFVVVLTKDMREQMRGAAYTALKDLESAAAVPFLEDGLSDGSALVRALVVEGLGKTEAGRRSPKLRKALDDQAGLVKAAALKVLGRTGDASALLRRHQRAALAQRALDVRDDRLRLVAGFDQEPRLDVGLGVGERILHHPVDVGLRQGPARAQVRERALEAIG